MPVTRRPDAGQTKQDEFGFGGDDLSSLLGGLGGTSSTPGVEPPPPDPGLVLDPGGRGDQSPRDRVGGAGEGSPTPDVRRVQQFGNTATPGQGGGGNITTPPRPTAPTPVASMAPEPFTPLPPSLTPQEETNPISRDVFGSAAPQSSSLLGKAGGLLGGGIGVPGVLGGEDAGPTAPTDFFANLIKRRGLQ